MTGLLRHARPRSTQQQAVYSSTPSLPARRRWAALHTRSANRARYRQEGISPLSLGHTGLTFRMAWVVVMVLPLFSSQEFFSFTVVELDARALLQPSCCRPPVLAAARMPPRRGGGGCPRARPEALRRDWRNMLCSLPKTPTKLVLASVCCVPAVLALLLCQVSPTA